MWWMTWRASFAQPFQKITMTITDKHILMRGVTVEPVPGMRSASAPCQTAFGQRPHVEHASPRSYQLNRIKSGRAGWCEGVPKSVRGSGKAVPGSAGQCYVFRPRPRSNSPRRARSKSILIQPGSASSCEGVHGCARQWECQGVPRRVNVSGKCLVVPRSATCCGITRDRVLIARHVIGCQ